MTVKTINRPKKTKKLSRAKTKKISKALSTKVAQKIVAGKLCAEPIEIFPQGISVSSALSRPIMVFKDKLELEVLPVWITPLDTGVALAELSHGSGATPHAVTRRLMEMLSIKLESCTFVDIIGHHQYVELKLLSADGVKTLRVRADEAMSFCIQGRARFFSTREFMSRCRSLDTELQKLENNILGGAVPGLQAEMENSSKKHPYVM
jgi:hypothetical protein